MITTLLLLNNFIFSFVLTKTACATFTRNVLAESSASTKKKTTSLICQPGIAGSINKDARDLLTHDALADGVGLAIKTRRIAVFGSKVPESRTVVLSRC